MRDEHRILFERIRIGRWELRNRIVLPPMVTNRDITKEDGILWYQQFAEGGVALVIVEAVGITRFEKELTPEKLKTLVDAVHREGALIAVQLFLAPFNSRNSPSQFTLKDISDVVEGFRRASAVCVEAGFDGVEPHGAHGFLLNQFFSPAHNPRTDQYGGHLEGRMRLALEIISAIRQQIGNRALILYRHTPKTAGSYQIQESLEFASRLEEVGLDILDISPASEQEPADLSAPFKSVVSIPVIAVNEMDEHNRAVKALREGRADLIAIGRGHIADPYWVAKTEKGQIDDIIPCKRCNEGCFGNLRRGEPIECVQRRQRS